MVNVDNINKVIEAIRNEDNFFNMSSFTMESMEAEHNILNNSLETSCGTPACICGWANHVAGHKDLAYMTSAAKFFGIIHLESLNLFLPTHKPLEEITRQEAILTLEHLRDTGAVKW